MGDLDGDGIEDIICTETSEGGRLKYILLSDLASTREVTSDSLVSNWCGSFSEIAGTVYWADMNNDGKIDAICFGEGPYKIALNNADGASINF